MPRSSHTHARKHTHTREHRFLCGLGFTKGFRLLQPKTGKPIKYLPLSYFSATIRISWKITQRRIQKRSLSIQWRWFCQQWWLVRIFTLNLSLPHIQNHLCNFSMQKIYWFHTFAHSLILLSIDGTLDHD